MAYFHTTVLDNQIKALPTVDTASGAIATFDTDLTENLVSCVCEVASGASTINVYDCGKNLANINPLTVASGDNIFVLVGSFYAIGGKTYTISCNQETALTSCTRNTINAIVDGFQFYETTTTNYHLDSGLHSLNITPLANQTIIIRFWGNTLSDETIYSNWQVEEGLIATAYESFNGTNINIPFGETLSGDGSFDVLSGILTRSDDTTKQLNANYIQPKNGINNVFADTGDTEVKFLLTVGKKIS